MSLTYAGVMEANKADFRKNYRSRVNILLLFQLPDKDLGVRKQIWQQTVSICTHVLFLPVCIDGVVKVIALFSAGS